MKTIEILVGIPCSGKSTYSFQKWYSSTYTKILSRDSIRNVRFGLNYKQNRQDELIVSMMFDKSISESLADNHCDLLILDNTHCKESYIDKIIDQYSDNYYIRIKFFNISLLQALYRNVKRYYKSKKWIPIKVMYNMYKNYNKINKKKYEKYILH